MTLRLPDYLTPAAIQFMPASTARFGPRSLGGVRQAVASDAGYWKARLVNIPVYHDRILLFRAIVYGRMQGPLNEILISPFDHRRAPSRRAANGDDMRSRFSDGATFSDGALFAPPKVNAYVVSSWPLRSTTVAVSVPTGLTIEPGQFIGIGDRLYLAHEVSIGGAGNLVHTCTIWPPLRALAAADTKVEIDDPVCLMRLSQADGYGLEVDYNDFGRVTLEFEEVITA